MADFGDPSTWEMNVDQFIDSGLPKEKPQELLDLQEQNRKQRLLQSLQKIGGGLEDSSLDFIRRENFKFGRDMSERGLKDKARKRITYSENKDNLGFRENRNEQNTIDKNIRNKKFLERNPDFIEDIKKNVYREANGNFIRRHEPLIPIKEIYKKYNVSEFMGREYSSAVKKLLGKDGILGIAEASDVKRQESIKKGIADAGPTVKPGQKKLKDMISSTNKKYIDLLAKDPKELIKTIRQKDNLMDQLKSVFKDGEVKKEKISDDEIKKLVKNGLYSEDHKTQVQTGSKNIEYNVNKSFVTKKTNSSVLAPMTMWLNKNWKKEDGKIKDPKIKNIKNWLTKNNINTKVEGERLYFGDDSLKEISAEAAHQRQLNYLETSSSKLGKTLKLAKATGKKLLQALNVLGQPSIAAGFGIDELRKGNIKTAGSMLLAPEFVGSFAPAGKGILSTIGRVAANPFGKAVRAFTPVGLATIAGGAGYDVYKETKRRQELTDEERLQEDIEAQAKDDEMMVGAAEGGFIEN